jgi:hypothetical protein
MMRHIRLPLSVVVVMVVLFFGPKVNPAFAAETPVPSSSTSASDMPICEKGSLECNPPQLDMPVVIPADCNGDYEVRLISSSTTPLSGYVLISPSGHREDFTVQLGAAQAFKFNLKVEGRFVKLFAVENGEESLILEHTVEVTQDDECPSQPAPQVPSSAGEHVVKAGNPPVMGELPVTGPSAFQYILVGIAAVLLGFLLAFASRNRRLADRPAQHSRAGKK